MRAATDADLETLRLGKLSTGGVVHRDCGGRVIYTFARDAFLCQGCQAVWYRARGRDSLYRNPVIDADVQE